jgi:hypothetical protein
MDQRGGAKAPAPASGLSVSGDADVDAAGAMPDDAAGAIPDDVSIGAMIWNGESAAGARVAGGAD